MHTAPWRSARRSFFPLLAGWLLAAMPAVASPGWDIVGLRLGMTEQEARAAVRAHAPQANITAKSLKFTYSDGAHQQETPAFLATLQVAVGGASPETLEIEFSAPPLEQRVISVRRSLSNYATPPALDRVQASLLQKYGRAVNEAKWGIASTDTTIDWAEPGKPLCGQNSGDSKGMVLPGPARMPADLRRYQQWQQQKRAPADLSTCSARLRANLTVQAGGASVVVMVVQMTDPGRIAPALQATTTWLDGLEASARKARLASGTTPKL